MRRSKVILIIHWKIDEAKIRMLFLAGRLPGHLPAKLPVLHIWGDQDTTGTPEMLPRMRKVITRLKEIRLLSKGHWIMVEASEEVTLTVLVWLMTKVDVVGAKL